VPAGMGVLDTPLQNTGTRAVLCLLLRFKDHKDRNMGLVNYDTISTLLKGTNQPQAPANTSVRDFYLRNSYEKLDLNFTVLDWIDSNMTEPQAADNKSGLKQSSKLTEAILDALEFAEADGRFVRSGFDQNGDGIIDQVFVMHSGYPAEMGTIDVDLTPSKDRIWSHRRRLKFFKESKPEVHARALKVRCVHLFTAVPTLKNVYHIYIIFTVIFPAFNFLVNIQLFTR
jgi:M6 family metalloprotease-like protein